MATNSFLLFPLRSRVNFSPLECWQGYDYFNQYSKSEVTLPILKKAFESTGIFLMVSWNAESNYPIGETMWRSRKTVTQAGKRAPAKSSFSAVPTKAPSVWEASVNLLDQSVYSPVEYHWVSPVSNVEQKDQVKPCPNSWSTILWSNFTYRVVKSIDRKQNDSCLGWGKGRTVTV